MVGSSVSEVQMMPRDARASKFVFGPSRTYRLRTFLSFLVLVVPCKAGPFHPPLISPSFFLSFFFISKRRFINREESHPSHCHP